MISNLIRNQIVLDDYARKARIAEAWGAYYGRYEKQLEATKSDPQNRDDVKGNNLCRLVVDKGISFLFGAGIDLSVGEEEETNEDVWLQQFWQKCKKGIFFHKMGLNGGVAGDVFVQIVPSSPYPRLINHIPENVTPVSSPHDVDEVLGYIISWNTFEARNSNNRWQRQDVLTRQVVIERNDNNKWLITTTESRNDSSNYSVVSEEVFPFDFCPIIHCQNLPNTNTICGLSDLEDLIQLNSSINRIMSNTARIIRTHAHPMLYGSGLGKKLEFELGTIINLPSPEAKILSVEMQSDLTSSLSYLEELKRSFHEISRIPEIATGRVKDLGQLSGLALQILYQPLLEKTMTKRALYGELISEISKNVLTMAGFGEQKINLQWGNPLPTNPRDEAEGAILEQQAGVSVHTSLSKRGYNATQEETLRNAERTTSADLLNQTFNAGR